MTEEEMQADIEKSYEHGLPDYLRDDLDNYKKAVEENRKIDACFLWGSFTAASTQLRSATALTFNWSCRDKCSSSKLF